MSLLLRFRPRLGLRSRLGLWLNVLLRLRARLCRVVGLLLLRSLLRLRSRMSFRSRPRRGCGGRWPRLGRTVEIVSLSFGYRTRGILRTGSRSRLCFRSGCDVVCRPIFGSGPRLGSAGNIVLRPVYWSCDRSGRGRTAMKIVDRSCGSGECRSRRRAMVALVEVGAILLCNVLMRDLCVHRAHATFSERCLFLRVCARIDATPSAVVADAIDGDVVDDGLVDVDIADDGGVYAADRSVVVEAVSAPVAAFITSAVVAEAVVHAAVEADMRAPVSGVPEVAAITPAPISRRPEHTDCRSEHPGSGNPVVVVAIPCPVAGCPDVVGTGANGLGIDRQGRWCGADCDSNAYLRERRSGDAQQQCCEN